MKLLTLLAGILACSPLAAAAAPDVGALIPDFEFHGDGGVVHTRADLLGRRGVVIAWFPKAFTPG